MNQKTLLSFDGDELPSSVFLQKYAMKNEKGELLEHTFSDVKNRAIGEILKCENENFKTKNENLEKEIKELFGDEKTTYFSPGGRILYGLGNYFDKTATFSNCYVTDLEGDSIEAIFELAKKNATIFSRGGGVGFTIGKLRPKGAVVNNCAKTTTGAVSFMDLFSTTTGIIGQYGRRGACLIGLEVTHPDIMDFIKIKGGEDKSKVQFANISVFCNDEFFKAVLNQEKWVTSFTLQNGETIKKTFDAKEIWDELVKSNYNGGEPGILFMDNIVKNEPCGVFDETRPVCTNPCGELPLAKWENCLLGSMNLSAFVNNPFTNESFFDFEKFEKMVKTAIRVLDDIMELNLSRQPLPKNKTTAENNRKLGLGITGLADMLIKLNLKYDTDEAIEFVDKIMYSFKKSSVFSSIELAEERGEFKTLSKYRGKKEFDDFVNHHYFEFLNDYPKYKEKFLKTGIRNSGWTTCAPNGSLAIILQGSSGIEPIFCDSYKRAKINSDGQKEEYVVYHPLVKQYNEIYGENAHLKNKNFVTANEINWEKRVKMQSVLQNRFDGKGGISGSISSTVNLPFEVEQATISKIYLTAWKNKLKGITIYRDGSRAGVLNKIKKKKKYKVLDEVKFPEETQAVMKIIRSEGRKWYVTYTIDEETQLPNSLFVNTNSTESEILTSNLIEKLEGLAEQYIKNGHLQKLKDKHHLQKNVTKICRTLSLLLRHRVPIIEIIQCLDNANLPLYSFAFQIKKLLSSFLEGEYANEKCPNCEQELVFEAGCKTCKHCGWSKCN